MGHNRFDTSLTFRVRDDHYMLFDIYKVPILNYSKLYTCTGRLCIMSVCICIQFDCMLFDIYKVLILNYSKLYAYTDRL